MSEIRNAVINYVYYDLIIFFVNTQTRNDNSRVVIYMIIYVCHRCYKIYNKKYY